MTTLEQRVQNWSKQAPGERAVVADVLALRGNVAANMEILARQLREELQTLSKETNAEFANCAEALNGLAEAFRMYSDLNNENLFQLAGRLAELERRTPAARWAQLRWWVYTRYYRVVLSLSRREDSDDE